MEPVREIGPGTTPETVWDVVIIGGGPAGLSAALTLLRARRTVLLIDTGEQRNLASPRMHGFLSREGTPPAEFLALCRHELGTYDAFTFLRDTVVHCRKSRNLFHSDTESGKRVRSHTLLLASGVIDPLPAIEGIREFYGKSVHHCPYCDAWEHRDQRIAVLGKDGQGADLAWELKAWSSKVTLIMTQKNALLPRHLARVRLSGVTLREGTPLRLEGEEGLLSRIVLSSGEALPVDALFFVSEEIPRCELAKGLQCELDGKHPRIGPGGSTSVNGCFAAGNLCKGRNMVVIAAAQGASTAIAINEYLLETAP